MKVLLSSLHLNGYTRVSSTNLKLRITLYKVINIVAIFPSALPMTLSAL